MRVPRFRITERQVLLWILAGLFLAYAATFIVAGLRQVAKPVEVNQPPRVRRMAPTESNRRDIRYLIEDMFDPSLLALPNQRGFSRRLWRGGPIAQAPPNDWNIRPAFLPASEPAGLPLLLERPTLTDLVENLAAKLPATDASTNAAMAFTPVTVTNSYLSVVNGTLGRRELLSQTELPVVTNATPLRATRVRVAVGADGAIQFASLERGCGSEPVDALAINWCRRLQFTPVMGAGTDGAERTWGVVRFDWATVRSSSTNGLAPPAISAP
jgi:hypothetical protein